MADICKLIFEHDLRLDALRERQLDRNVQETGPSLEDFLKPDPTYSKFYLAGTLLGPDEPKFGLSALAHFNGVRNALEHVAAPRKVLVEGNKAISLSHFLDDAGIGTPAIITAKNEVNADYAALTITKESNIGHKKEELAAVLKAGDWVLYKEPAHQGYDLHLFSKENIYSRFFYPFRELVSGQFRFFSINGKKITSERKFYFETWTLHRPPHGAEEVFPETEI